MIRQLATAAVLACAAPCAPGEEVSFSRDLVPVLRTVCATCHLMGTEEGHLQLHPGAAYRSLVGVPSVESALVRVAPGAPEKSYLLHKLEGTHLSVGGTGERMPLGQPPLENALRDRFRAWVAEGAKDN